MTTKIYLLSSLKNTAVPLVGNDLRALGYDVFDDWYAGGYEADDRWQDYERVRGRSYQEALYGHHATEVFEFDLKHIRDSDIAVMLMPCGKSGHLELGYFLGSGKPGFILYDKEPDRFEIMPRFATGIAFSRDELYPMLAKSALSQSYQKQLKERC